MTEQHMSADELATSDILDDLPDEASYDIKQFTKEEAQDLFDKTARRFLNVSGDEFRIRWHRGDYDDDPDRFEVMMVAMSLPLVEREKVT